MELSDAERECRADAADAEQEEWHMVQNRVLDMDCVVACLDYARNSEHGPYLELYTSDRGIWVANDPEQIDKLIDALNEARTWCFGPRSDT